MDTEPTEEEKRKRRARVAIICTCAKTWVRPQEHSGACNYIAGRVAAALHTYAEERVRAAHEAGQRDMRERAEHVARHASMEVAKMEGVAVELVNLAAGCAAEIADALALLSVRSAPVPDGGEGKVPASSPQAAPQEKAREPGGEQ